MSHDLGLLCERDRTLDLATFLFNLTLDNLPSGVIHHAKASILNSIGCGLSAGPLESHLKMLSVLDIASKQSYGGSFREATILDRPERASVEDAAMLNGLAMTARFFDDTHLSTVVHPSGPSLAALLAYAEAYHHSGKELLLAFVVGVEATLATAAALGIAPYKRGWHTTSITGTFGATAAIAKIMKLSPTQFAHALGHASSMTGGTRGVFGTDSLSMHAGRAAQNGILAAKMAKNGLVSTTYALEKWIRLVGQDDENSAALTALVGARSANDRRWLILENAFKPYPCGIVIHPAIDAAVAAHKFFSDNADTPALEESPRDALDLVRSIEAMVTPLTVRLCGIRHPQDATQTIFSTYHGITTGLICGKAGIREFAMDVVNDPLIKAMRSRITLTTDEKLEDDQASLTIRYRDNAGIEKEKQFFVEHATGSLLNPMTNSQLEQKFADQASIGGIDGADARQAIRDNWNLTNIDDIASITKNFVPTKRETKDVNL